MADEQAQPAPNDPRIDAALADIADLKNTVRSMASMTAFADFSEKTSAALLAIEERVHDLEMAANTPHEAGPTPNPNRSATEGEVVWYTGDESGGTKEHVAVVTRVIDSDTINATVLFDGSAPAARKGLKRSEKQWAFEPATKE
jgi:hypothetical protein